MNNSEISLRDYVESRFQAMDEKTALALAAVKEQTSLALTAAKEAVTKAEVASEKRFEAVNKFREALDDNARLLMPRLEAEQINRQLTEKIDEIVKRVNARDDRGQGLHQGWLVLVAVIGVVLGIAALVYGSR